RGGRRGDGDSSGLLHINTNTPTDNDAPEGTGDSRPAPYRHGAEDTDDGTDSPGEEDGEEDHPNTSNPSRSLTKLLAQLLAHPPEQNTFAIPRLAMAVRVNGILSMGMSCRQFQQTRSVSIMVSPTCLSESGYRAPYQPCPELRKSSRSPG